MSYWTTKPTVGCAINRNRAAVLGLVNLWLLSEGAGGFVKDSVGGSDGILSGGASLGASPLGNAARFNGTSQAIKCPTNSIAGGFSVFWYGILYTSTAGGLICKGDNSNPGDCGLQLATLSGSTRKWQFFLFNNDTDGDGDSDGSFSTSPGVAAPTGVPMMIVGTYDPNTALALLYQNGQVIASATAPNNDDSSFSANTSLIDIGAFAGSESTTSVNCITAAAGFASRTWSPADVASFLDPYSLYLPPAPRRSLILPKLVGAPFLMDSEMTGMGTGW